MTFVAIGVILLEYLVVNGILREKQKRNGDEVEGC
jgi:hypothetical protein